MNLAHCYPLTYEVQYLSRLLLSSHFRGTIKDILNLFYPPPPIPHRKILCFDMP